MKNTETVPQLTFTKALIGFLLPLAVVIALVLLGNDIVIALLMAMFVLAVYGLIIGFKWSFLQDALMAGGSSVLGAVLIMIFVGMTTGVWMACGSVPSMLYYGLELINPKFFCPIAFLICALTSLATGTSWGTAATMGVALIGVGGGLGIPLGLVAGAVISGAHVGDKLSPLSDTTLLSSASTKTNLFDHIVSMLYTTVPISVICLVLYSVLGYKYGSQALNIEQIEVIKTGIATDLNISPWMLIPPALVIILSVKKVPATASFGIGIVFSVIWGMIFQGESLNDMFNYAINGYVSQTGVEGVDSLLSRGGAVGMASTIYVSILAGMFAGLLDKMTILSTLMTKVKKVVHTPGNLIATTVAACVALMVGGGGQYCTLTLPGVAFRESYDELDVNSAVLSRTMEDTGTLIGSIIPWDVSAIFFATALGVATLEYLPFAFLPLITPFLAIIGGYLGYGILHKDEKVVYKPFYIRKKNVS